MCELGEECYRQKLLQAQLLMDLVRSPQPLGLSDSWFKSTLSGLSSEESILFAGSFQPWGEPLKHFVWKERHIPSPNQRTIPYQLLHLEACRADTCSHTSALQTKGQQPRAASSPANSGNESGFKKLFKSILVSLPTEDPMAMLSCNQLI